MNKFEEFIKANEEDAGIHLVHLTSEQVQMTRRVSDVLGISFEDTVMILVQLQCAQIGPGYYRNKAQFERFTSEHQGNFETVPVKLTDQQLEVVEVLSDVLDTSFKDAVAILVYAQFASIGHAWITASTIKN